MLRYSCRANKEDDEWINKNLVEPQVVWEKAKTEFINRYKKRDLKLSL